MNHVQFFPPHNHHHYSCLCLFDLCTDNFVKRSFTSFHTGFCNLVCSLAKKFSSFSQFKCIMPHSAYFLYCTACLHRKQKEAYKTKKIFLFFLCSNMKPNFVYCLYCAVCIHIKQKVTRIFFAAQF